MELDKKCDSCNGKGYHAYCGDCGFCQGTGYELTELGEELLKFIKRHFKVELV